MGQAVFNTAKRYIDNGFMGSGFELGGYRISPARLHYMVENGLEEKYWEKDAYNCLHVKMRIPRNHPLLIKAVMSIEDSNMGERLKVAYFIGQKYEIIEHSDGTEAVLAPSIIDEKIIELLKEKEEMFGISINESLTNFNEEYLHN